MKPKPTRRRARVSPLYPSLLAAAALGAATLGCGPDLEASTINSQTQQLAPMPPDAGSEPTPPDFLGGDMAYETLPDGGIIP